MKKPESQPTIVYIDGENLLHRAEEVLSARRLITHKTDITHLDISWLMRQVLPEYDQLLIRYYGTKLKLSGIVDQQLKEKAERMVESQRRLKRDLTKQGIDFITSGNLKLRDGQTCRKCGHQEPVFQEKGVDVKLAVDMMQDEPLRLKAVLVSSDSDLLPALRALVSKGSETTYVAYEASVNRALVAMTSGLRTYTSRQLVDAFERGSHNGN